MCRIPTTTAGTSSSASAPVTDPSRSRRGWRSNTTVSTSPMPMPIATAQVNGGSWSEHMTWAYSDPGAALRPSSSHCGHESSYRYSTSAPIAPPTEPTSHASHSRNVPSRRPLPVVAMARD